MSPKLEDKDLLNRGTSAVASRGNTNSASMSHVCELCFETPGDKVLRLD
jgi:hypothetical protein